MESRIIQGTGPNGARAEIGVVVHEGREFSALGSIVDLAQGRITGYVARDASSGRIYLASWGGECMFIGLRAVSTWRTPGSYVSSTMTAYATVLDGHRWTGRGAGEGMLLTLKRGAKL